MTPVTNQIENGLNGTCCANFAKRGLNARDLNIAVLHWRLCHVVEVVEKVRSAATSRKAGDGPMPPEMPFGISFKKPARRDRCRLF
jgi:hypothetical protein